MRTTTKLLTVATLLLGAGCGHSSGSSSDSQGKFIDGFTPPAPAPGDIQIVTPVYQGLDAGTDKLFCTYIANPFSGESDVIASVGMMSKFGHHAVLYDVADQGTPGDTHICNDNDMTRARLLGGAVDSAQNFPIPDGIAIRVHPTSNIMIQTHWINPSAQPAVGQAVFNVTTRPADGTRQPAQSFTVYTTNFTVKSHAAGHAVTECPIQQDLSLFFLAAHEHAWGQHAKIEQVSGGMTNPNAPSTALIDSAWTPEYATNPPRKSYTKDAPLVFHKGDTMRVTCDWMNTTDHDMTFPEEMCVGFGMFFPAVSDIDCGDGQWSGATQP